MRIAIFSMGPVFKDAVHGGSQKTLREIALAIGEAGHSCRIYCTLRADNYSPFQLSKNVQVLPILRFKETYPEPYYSAPYKLQEIISILQTAVADCDVFYIHDAELLYHFLYSNVPTVTAIQDFVYPDTLAGCLSFRRDRLIVTSEYIKSAVVSTFNQFCELGASDVTVIPNGFDIDALTRRDSESLREAIGLPTNCVAILYPHRPDPKKGIFEAIEVINRLRQKIPAPLFERLKLLIPRWMDSNVVENEAHVYQQLYGAAIKFAEELGLTNKLVIHDWVPLSRMPEYYSLGAATLCIGSFIEAFGNVSIESELCGTPAIISRVGAQRSILPEQLSTKVDFGDLDGASELLAEIIMKPQNKATEVRAYVHKNYLARASAEKYLNTITSCQMRLPIRECMPQQLANNDFLSIPAWCAPLRRGYYNDYEYGYVNGERLLSLVAALQGSPKAMGQLVQLGFTSSEIACWIHEGRIVRYRQ